MTTSGLYNIIGLEICYRDSSIIIEHTTEVWVNFIKEISHSTKLIGNEIIFDFYLKLSHILKKKKNNLEGVCSQACIIQVSTHSSFHLFL